MTVAMNSHTTGKYRYQMIEKMHTVSADSMSKRGKRASESHEQIVSRMCMASLRASETHAQTLQKQADGKKRMASLRGPWCKEVCQ